MRAITLFLLTLLFTAAASAQVYRWVDENGKVHYSDTPPPEENAEALDIDSDARIPANKANSGKDNADSASSDTPPPSKQALTQKRCELAKMTLASYREAETLVKTDDQGNKQSLSAEEKTAAIKQAEARVGKLCATDG